MSCPCRQCQGLGPAELKDYDLPENPEDYECRFCGLPVGGQFDGEYDGDIVDVEYGVPTWELYHINCKDKEKRQ